MKIAELKKLSPQEREKKVKETKIELLKLHGQVQTGTAPKSPGMISKLKKILARLQTAEQEEKMAKAVLSKEKKK